MTSKLNRTNEQKERKPKENTRIRDSLIHNHLNLIKTLEAITQRGGGVDLSTPCKCYFIEYHLKVRFPLFRAMVPGTHQNVLCSLHKVTFAISSPSLPSRNQ